MIEGVIIKKLKIIPDERGKVMHMLKAGDQEFENFGEIYFSTVYPGVVKGWHFHKRMTLYYAVPVGMVKLVLYDQRKKSKTFGEIQEIFMGEDNYVLVIIPPRIWNGFKGIGVKPALLANCPSLPHDPEEIIRKDPHTDEIPYEWKLVCK